MEFFKKETSEKGLKDSKLVGAEIPTNIFYYINLFCVADSRSKVSIIKPLIEKWAKKAQKRFTEERLLELAAEKGYASWQHRNNRKMSFATVLKIQSRELKRRGLSENHIEIIIKKIQDAKSKEN